LFEAFYFSGPAGFAAGAKKEKDAITTGVKGSDTTKMP